MKDHIELINSKVEIKKEELKKPSDLTDNIVK